MPLDDFRRQIDAKVRVDLDIISHCADRYRVSLIAAVLRWLSYTQKRAVLVVSRDGFILWARSSRSEEHTSELQSQMRNSYAVFCLKKKTSRNDEQYESDT